MKPVYLHPGRERRLLQGHRWVFSNEIAAPLGDYEPGSWVEVFSARGVSLGCGYINPASLITVRLAAPPGRKPGAELFRDALDRAARHRERVYPGARCCRLVFGESDNLPGLVVDRYGDVVVCQTGTLGMAKLEPLIYELLVDMFKPAALVFRNDSPSRALEGLPREKGVAHGQIPEEVSVEIDGIRYAVDVLDGQKTGMFLDQRDNRSAARRWMKGKRVLDLFCYNGAWGLSAAEGGAEEVVGVDVSTAAVDAAARNAELNGLGGKCSFVADDVFDYLKKVERGTFDIIILDPPAFAKSKSAVPEARKGYTDINRRAMLALRPGGLLISCSCSYHVGEELFRDILVAASQASGRGLRLLQARGQALDHPALPAMPETRYLKCFVLQVL